MLANKKRLIPYVEDLETGDIRVPPDIEARLLRAAHYYSKEIVQIRTKTDLVMAMFHAWIGQSLKDISVDARKRIEQEKAQYKADSNEK